MPDVPNIPSPKSYINVMKPHVHSSWDCTQIVFNYYDFCMRYFPFLSKEQIINLPMSSNEKINYYIQQPEIIFPPSSKLDSWTLPRNRVGDGSSIPHQDNPAYQASYFDAYQRHGHTPYEGGPIFWNNLQWIRKLNVERYIWKKTQPQGVKEGFEEKFGAGYIPCLLYTSPSPRDS